MAEDHYYCTFPNYTFSNDFSLYEIGTQRCLPLHDYGPIVRAHHIFHYVFSGKGYLILNNKRFEVTGKQGFLIPSNVIAYYQADPDDPWHYTWIHIDGPVVNEIFEEASLSSETPIFLPENYAAIENIFQELIMNYENQYFCIGKIYELFDCLTASSKKTPKKAKLPSENTKLQYVRTIINYIQIKYCDNIHVDNIAAACGLNRSYMTRLFKDVTNYTVQEYLLYYRMKKACELLEENTYSVQYVAYAVGYGDAFTFSKAFKRYMQYCPSDYKGGKPPALTEADT